MANLEDLQQRFPRYKIRAQPASGCTCKDGIRKMKDGSEYPCLCVCMDAPNSGEPEYRVDACNKIASIAREILAEMRNPPTGERP